MLGPHARRRTLLLLITLLVFPGARFALAQNGGVVVHDQTPIYANAKGDWVEFTVAKNTPVAGIEDFEEKDGRVHVLYFKAPDQKGLERKAWMNPADIERFEYDCSCDKRGKCSAVTLGFSSEWTECFKKAKDGKVVELAGGPSLPASNASNQAQRSKALKNDDIVALTKAGLGDDIIVSKITQSPETDFDTSVDALIRLKKEGVGKGTIDAMVKQPQKGASAVKKGKAVPANQVRVETNTAVLSTCQRLGTVHAVIDTYRGGGSDTVIRRLQEMAAKKGGNVIVLMGSFTTIKQQNGSDMMGDAEVYSCAE
jgi:hypothetical protein